MDPHGLGFRDVGVILDPAQGSGAGDGKRGALNGKSRISGISDLDDGKKNEEEQRRYQGEFNGGLPAVMFCPRERDRNFLFSDYFFDS